MLVFRLKALHSQQNATLVYQRKDIFIIKKITQVIDL